jgi:hypothetical protein
VGGWGDLNLWSLTGHGMASIWQKATACVKGGCWECGPAVLGVCGDGLVGWCTATETWSCTGGRLGEEGVLQVC